MIEELCWPCWEANGGTCESDPPHGPSNHPCPTRKAVTMNGKTKCPQCGKTGEWIPATEAHVDSLYAKAWGIAVPSSAMEPPDTTEAAAEALRNTYFHFEPSYGLGDAQEAAEIVLAAHRKSLNEQGWTETPRVKVDPSELVDMVMNVGGGKTIAWLNSLGLPIEIEE